MKTLECSDCQKYLGEMTQGKIKRDIVILCSKCADKMRTLKSLDNFEKQRPKTSSTESMDFFKNIDFLK
jgi:hypothetical protein